jgi:hypothetical protein
MRTYHRSVVAAVCALCPSVCAGGSPAHYIGANNNWYSPGNWSTGSVPGSTDDVLIDGTSSVVIDPTQGDPNVVIRDLTVAGSATLETFPNTIFTLRNETITDSGRVIHRSTEVLDVAGDPGVADYGGASGLAPGTTLNPTAQLKRDVILKSSFTLTMGLGGNAPASPGNVGAGFYANIAAENVMIDGNLQVQLLHGFTPTVGESYKIIDARVQSSGQFNGLSEGELVAAFGDVGLFITYAGGDGNDVVLQAATDVPAIGEWGMAALSLALVTAGTLLLRRQRARA